MIALRMEDDALGGNGLQLFFQLVHVFGAADLAGIRQTKYKVAKAKLLGQYLAQIFE